MHTDDEIKKLFQQAGPIYPEIDIEVDLMKKVQLSAQRKKAFYRYQRFGKFGFIGFTLFSILFFMVDHSKLSPDDMTGLITTVFAILCLLLIQFELLQKNKKTIFSD